MTTAIHPFEKSGLGKAPFRYVGMVYQEISYGERVIGSVGGVPVATKPGGTCDHCGAYIVDMFRIVSGDGIESKVGCDCIDKVNQVLGTARIADDRKKAKQAREKARIAAAIVALDSAHLLRSQPHPTAWRAGQGDTMIDYCRWMFANAGHTGKLATARIVEKAIAPRVDD